MWSTARACRASVAGSRSGIWATDGAMRMRSVAWATAASTVHRSNQGFDGSIESANWSPVPARSKPSASACRKRSSTTDHSRSGRIATWNRNSCAMSSPPVAEAPTD